MAEITAILRFLNHFHNFLPLFIDKFRLVVLEHLNTLQLGKLGQDPKTLLKCLF